MTSIFESSTNKKIWNFSPAIIPGCVLWLDAADPNTITMEGSNVVAWKDKSIIPTADKVGGSTGLTLSGAPTLTLVTQNGINTIAFNGGTSILSTTTNITRLPTGNASGTYFVVARTTASAALPQMMFEYGGTTRVSEQEKTIRALYFSSDSSRQPYTDLFSGVRNQAGDGQYAVGNYAIISSSQPYTLPLDMITSTSFINGTAFDNNTDKNTITPNIGTTRFSVGAGASNTGGLTFHLTGNVAEILVYSTVLSTAERQQVERYLGWKWGLQASLPSGGGIVRPFLDTFSPLYLSGTPSMWYDGADRGSITTVGNRITQWNDKSGGSRHVTNTSSSGITGPTITSTDENAVGYNIIFTGSQNLRNTTMSEITSSAFTYFLVIFHNERRYGRFVSGSDRIDGSIGARDSTDPAGFIVSGDSLSSNVRVYRGTPFVEASGATLGRYHIVSCVWTGTQCDVYINGQLRGNFSATTQLSFSRFSIGSDAAGEDRFLGRTSAGGQSPTAVNEILTYTRAFSDSERQRVEGYLSWKWGLHRKTPRIPETHSFYKFPPARVVP